MTKPIRVQISPLTERIYAGRINAAGDAWSGEKFDVTSDVFGAVIEKIKPGHKTIVTRQDGKQFEVEVREIGAAGAQEAPRNDLTAIYDMFGIGEQARSIGTLTTSIRNTLHFTDLLHAVEREFFMVPGEPDDDYPDDEPADECILNSWGSTTEQYIEQFRAALAALSASSEAPSEDANLSDEQIVEVLASLGIDSEKSKYGFDVLQVRTTVPGIRDIVKAYRAALAAATQTEKKP